MARGGDRGRPGHPKPGRPRSRSYEDAMTAEGVGSKPVFRIGRWRCASSSRIASRAPRGPQAGAKSRTGSWSGNSETKWLGRSRSTQSVTFQEVARIGFGETTCRPPRATLQPPSAREPLGIHRFSVEFESEMVRLGLTRRLPPPSAHPFESHQFRSAHSVRGRPVAPGARRAAGASAESEFMGLACRRKSGATRAQQYQGVPRPSRSQAPAEFSDLRLAVQ